MQGSNLRPLRCERDGTAGGPAEIAALVLYGLVHHRVPQAIKVRRRRHSVSQTQFAADDSHTARGGLGCVAVALESPTWRIAGCLDRME